MKRLKIALCVSLLCASAAAVAAETQTDSDREQRMSEALERYRQTHDADGRLTDRRADGMDERGRHDRRYRRDHDLRGHAYRDHDMRRRAYRDQDPRNPEPGPAARTENRVKHGVRSAAHSVSRVADKVGNAVTNGLHKAGRVGQESGEKVEDKVDSKR